MSLLLPDSNEFADVRAVVAELVAQTHIDPDNLLLIGARCRDLLHRQLGHTTAVRGTDDVDIAVAVDSLADYRAIVGTLKSTGSTEARFMVGDFAVDIMPFGAIENPKGSVSLNTRHDSLSVDAFHSIWKSAPPLALGGTVAIRVPSVAGYAVLKAHAFAERSKRFEYKDAEDIATALAWYAVSEVIIDEVYSSELGLAVLETTDFDLQAATAYLLGVHMHGQLSASEQENLRRAWLESSDDLLTVSYGRHSGTVDARNSVDALRRAIVSKKPPYSTPQCWPL